MPQLAVHSFTWDMIGAEKLSSFEELPFQCWRAVILRILTSAGLASYIDEPDKEADREQFSDVKDSQAWLYILSSCKQGTKAYMLVLTSQSAYDAFKRLTKEAEKMMNGKLFARGLALGERIGEVLRAVGLNPYW